VLNEINQAVLEFMRTRRSVPAKIMAGPGPSSDEILKMAEIAVRVPDHGKIAPWRMVEYSDSAKVRLGEKILARALAKTPDLNEEQQELERTRLSRSSTVIALFSAPVEHPKVPEWEQQLSCGAVGMNWLIAANAFGYDAQWLSEWYAFDDFLKADLGATETEQIAGFIHIGTRTMPKTERARPQVADILTRMD